MEEEIIFDSVGGTFVGIDLGTSNSVISYFKNGKFEQIRVRGGKNTIPSALYFEKEERIIFGERALKKGRVKPEFLLTEFKTHLGSNKKYKFEFNKKEFLSKKTYVIDTNIFINEPYVLDLFSKDDQKVVPIKVIDELSYREEQEETEVAAKIAIGEIEKVKNEGNIRFEAEHLELLGEDLEKDSKNSINDNKILSIAKYLKEEEGLEVILITEDKGLKLKAELPENKITTFTVKQLKEDKARENNSQKGEELIITPKDASRLLLEYLKDESEKVLGEYIEKAVITVPANFTKKQIGLVKEAGEEAGFIEVRIQKEPVAVGFAYALDSKEDKTILVYDFGGGTFDASLLIVEDGHIEVLNTDGDPNLGGKNITEKLGEFIYEKICDETDDELDMFEEENGLTKDEFYRNKSMINLEAERVKIELSDLMESTVYLPTLIMPGGELKPLEINISRKEFEDEIAEIRKTSLDIVKDLIVKSNIEKEEIDEVVIAGGSSLIPSISNSLKDTLGIDIKSNIDSSIVISRGALLEGVREWEDDKTIQKKIVYNDAALVDFGVGIKNRMFDEIIETGINLPCQGIREYSTLKDNQEKLEIMVFERGSLYKDVKFYIDKGINYIGKIEIENLPARKIGELIIQVIFELTKDDTLETTVKVMEKSGEVIEVKHLKISEASNG